MKDPNIQLWCEDEVHFQRHSSLMRMWAPKGQQPHVPSASTREKVGFFGAVNLKTGVLVTKDAPTFNSETFGDFLDYLLQATHGEDLSDSGQRQVAQSKSLERFFHPEPGPSGADFSATLFARTQPGRAGVENYPQARHPQSLFPFGRRTQDGSDFSFYEMVATK